MADDRTGELLRCTAPSSRSHSIPTPGRCRIVPVLIGPSLFHETPALNRFHGVPAQSTSGELPPHDGERVPADLAAKPARMSD